MEQGIVGISLKSQTALLGNLLRSNNKSHNIAYTEYLHFYPVTRTVCEVYTIDIISPKLR